MQSIKPVVMVWVALVFAGCATGPVAKGAIIGAASGAALGAGTGVLISNEDLLGSSSAPATGNLALDKGPTIGASTLIGVVFGGIVGAMVGHAHDDGEPEAPPPAASAQADHVRPAAF